MKTGQHAAPRTGVGTPDGNAEAAGAALGGDTGDVGTPRDELEHEPGGTGGTHATPEWSANRGDAKLPVDQAKRRRHAA